MADVDDLAQPDGATLIVQVGMPQMAVRGLSENWLFKFCGDRHWKAIAELYGARAGEIATENGERIYSSFVAIRGRYKTPLALIDEDASIVFELKMDQFGPGILRSRHVGTIDGGEVICMEMISKFVMRAREGRNQLLGATARPRAGSKTAPEMPELPPLMRAWQAMKGTLPLQGEKVQQRRYVPNPYIDYNGAGLLYFAAYPTIVDHCERLHINRSVSVDWAISTSAIERDVFYFGNLDLASDLDCFTRVEINDGAADTAATILDADESKRLCEVRTKKVLI